MLLATPPSFSPQDLRPFVAQLADEESPRSLLALFAEYETKTDEETTNEVTQLLSDGVIESSRAKQLSEFNAANRRRALLARVLEIHAELDDDEEGDQADCNDPYGKEEGDDESEGDEGEPAALTADYISGLTAADCLECPEAAEDEAVRDVPRWIMGRPTAELVEMAAALGGEAGEAPSRSSSRLELVQTLLRATMAAEEEEEEGEDGDGDEDEIGNAEEEEVCGGEEHAAAAGGVADEGEAPSTPPGKRLPAPDGCAQQ